MGNQIASFLVGLLPQLFVGGAIFSLISVLVTRRSLGKKLAADTHKVDVEAEGEFVTTARNLVAGLREQLDDQSQLVLELQERIRLADRQVAVFTRQAGRLTSDLMLARAELAAARADLAMALRPPAVE